jgi:serine/threonine protein kinase
MIGKTILHYKVVAKLGEGGMGVVYKAEDTKLDRSVAIKFLPSQVAAKQEERERFKIEAQAASAGDHNSNIRNTLLALGIGIWTLDIY